MNERLRHVRHGDLAIVRNPTMKRDEFLDWMTFEGGEHIPFKEIFGPLIGLKEEWKEQGATSEELDFSAFKFREPRMYHVAVNTGPMKGGDRIIEETDSDLYYLDGLGRKMHLCKGVATIALPESWPVEDMDSWLKIKPLFEFDENRFAKDWEENALTERDRDAVITASIPGGFDMPRALLGEERLCYAFYDQPELIHDILNTVGRTASKVLDMASSKARIDYLSVHEDLAGKSGPLIGPEQIKEFIAPYYLRIWNMLHERGARIFDQDSDGDINSVIDAFLEAGINCAHPMEPAANMDIVKVRNIYGNRLAFCGGIDKYVLLRSQEEIETELEYKIPPMIKTRGCVIGLDHRIPNGVPLKNYRFYIEKVWEIIEREERNL